MGKHDKHPDQKKADAFDESYETSRKTPPSGHTHPSDRPLSDGPRSSDYRDKSY